MPELAASTFQVSSERAWLERLNLRNAEIEENKENRSIASLLRLRVRSSVFEKGLDAACGYKRGGCVGGEAKPGAATAGANEKAILISCGTGNTAE
jgi:hypothetical protein